MATMSVNNSVVLSTSLTQRDMDDTEFLMYHTQLQQQVIDGNMDAVECMAKLGLLWKKELTPAQQPPLHVAIREKNMEQAIELLKIQNMMQEPNTFGATPMHLACQLGLGEIVKILIDMGADINALDRGDCTPLFYAVSADCIQCVRLLVQAGCDLDALTFELLSPMDQAVQYNLQNIVALLLRAGCSTCKLLGHVYYRDHFSNSFFCALWDRGALDNMRLFLDCGYTFDRLQRIALKKTCTQLIVHETERETLKILNEYFDQPQTLTWLCRQSVRQVLMNIRRQHHTPMDAMISKLPVPEKVRQFLMLKETETIVTV